MRLTKDAERAVIAVQSMEPGEILSEYESLLYHATQDALDRAELLMLAACCLSMATPSGVTFLT